MSTSQPKASLDDTSTLTPSVTPSTTSTTSKLSSKLKFWKSSKAKTPEPSDSTSPEIIKEEERKFHIGRSKQVKAAEEQGKLTAREKERMNADAWGVYARMRPGTERTKPLCGVAVAGGGGF
ncbi:hypothetical protein BJ508DRAFT_416414 [Ascobolus immersus RN42]|uniref:Uncharacterized protein n=1 Tax=Ascobolus immersus RN42 TaxID=1160509 RepID=A0A3N4HYD1_ASCIM|nr:hypothetical protein BJ508DRAFT_416414 [Ascobolus immersus RN42]